MVTINEIKAAIRRLPADRLSELRAWFDEYNAQLWDRQIERDVEAGRLDLLAGAALEAHRAGRSTQR